jgi:hypothetical protein
VPGGVYTRYLNLNGNDNLTCVPRSQDFIDSLSSYDGPDPCSLCPGASACSEAITTPTPDIEGSLMEAAQKYPNCQCTLSWQEIRRSNPRTRTGGLGEFLVEGKYEVWVCLQDKVCSTLDDWFCYVFNEQTLTFKAWGFNAEVKVVKNALN